ncbi:MAG: thymidylate kinase [Gemmatimonadetes bacterium]|nr:thymidylate kinase [Gemmatimonadota bacterium]
MVGIDLHNGEIKGRVIAVEGLDGSGKSTQIYLLKRWLEMTGHRVWFTEWNSSELVRGATKKAKKGNALTPTTFSLIHCTDFADRFERQMLPLLRAGYFVLCDRYVYTAYARDGVRGVPDDWLRNLYSFAPEPAITFYFRPPLKTALDRILVGRPRLKFHEAGMDLGLSTERTDSFKMYQGKIMEAYEAMCGEFEFEIVNGALPVEEQQRQVRSIVSERLDLGSLKIEATE